MNWAIVDEGANTANPNVEDVDLTVFRRWGVDETFDEVEVVLEVAGVGEEGVAVESDIGLIGSALLVVTTGDESSVKGLVEKELLEEENIS